MPFTLSHPAAVIVLRRTGLPVGAMVAGTMAPDLPLFVHSPSGYRLTHSVLGIVTADVAIGLAGLAGWLFLVHPAVVDSAPAFLRHRLAARTAYTRRQWGLAAPAVVVGALTHVGWDELTHQGRWGPQHIAWLRETHFGRAGYHLAQAASGVLGLAVVAVWVLTTVLRRPPVSRPARVPALAGWLPWTVAAVGAVTGVVTLAALAGQGLHAMVLAAVVRGLAAGAAALIVAATGWNLLARWSG